MLLKDTDREIIEHICEYIEVWRDEPPESLILLSTVYQGIRRIIGNACEEKESSEILPKGWN